MNSVYTDINILSTLDAGRGIMMMCGFIHYLLTVEETLLAIRPMQPRKRVSDGPGQVVGSDSLSVQLVPQVDMAEDHVTSSSVCCPTIVLY